MKCDWEGWWLMQFYLYCGQGDIDSRGYKEIFGELSGVMDYEEDRI